MIAFLLYAGLVWPLCIAFAALLGWLNTHVEVQE